MIYPTARLVFAVVGGATFALVIGIAVPGLWLLPLAWTLVLLLGAGADALATAGRAVTLRIDGPRAVEVGDRLVLTLLLGRRPGPAAEVAVAAGPLLRFAAGGRATVDAGGRAQVEAAARRRGTAALAPVGVRWQGPLGLAWRLRRIPVTHDIVISPAVRTIGTEGVALLSRDARAGLIAQLNTGPGGEFEALAEYQPGMDRRRIAWKQSARHGALLAKEFRVERDNNIVLAFDCGRTMVEPIGTLPRLDRAIAAGLLTGYVALKMGDRVSLFGFDARVRQLTPPRSGPGSFGSLRRAAADLDYAAEESNFTLALSTLAQRLDRRSLIILFTDFADPTAAQLTLRAIGKLLSNHVLLCVTMRDDDLETLVTAAPRQPDDVARAVIAAGLLRERRVVLNRLRQLGVEVLEAPWRELGPALAKRYLDTKRRQLL